MTLGAIAAALVSKAADKAAERAVEGGGGVLARLVGWMRRRFAGDDQHEAQTALADVEQVPDSPSRLQALAEVIDRRAEADAGFRSELEALVKQAQAGGVDVGTIAQTAWGDQNVQIAGVEGSSINLTYGQPPPSD